MRFFTKRNLGRIILLLTSSLLTAAVGLYFLLPEYPRAGMTINPQFGPQHQPGFYFFHKTDGLETQHKISYNRFGFRDIDRPLRKPPGIQRLVVIGDSFVEALAVPEEKRFTTLLQEILNKNGYPVEVIPLGISGAGTAKEYVFLKNYAFQYNPDVVMLLIYPINDLADNIERLHRDFIKSSLGDQVNPHFVDSVVKLHLHATFEEENLRFIPPIPGTSLSWVNRSRLFAYNAQVRNFFVPKEEFILPEKLKKQFLARINKTLEKHENKDIDPLGMLSFCYRKYLWEKQNRKADWYEAKQVFYSLLKKMNNLCRLHSVDFFTIILLAPPNNPFPNDLEVYYRCQDYGIPSFPIRFLINDNIYYFDEMLILGDGHFNTNGHKVFAEQLFAYIEGNEYFYKKEQIQ